MTKYVLHFCSQKCTACALPKIMFFAKYKSPYSTCKDQTCEHLEAFQNFEKEQKQFSKNQTVPDGICRNPKFRSQSEHREALEFWNERNTFVHDDAHLYNHYQTTTSSTNNGFHNENQPLMPLSI